MVWCFTNTQNAEIIDNHFASLGTSLEGNLDLGILADNIEKEKATEDFFGGIEVREAPTPDHVPVVDEDGFVDRREGLEDWPQLWQPDKETLADYVVPGCENSSTQHNNTPILVKINGEKQILQPKSQKNKVRLQDPSFPKLISGHHCLDHCSCSSTCSISCPGSSSLDDPQEEQGTKSRSQSNPRQRLSCYQEKCSRLIRHQINH